jgi:type II secretory pathway component PulF
MLIGLADAIKAAWWIVLPAVLAISLGIWYYSRRKGVVLWDALCHALPSTRKLMERIMTARFSRTLGSMLAGGVPILDSLEISGASMGSPRAAEAVSQAREQVREGVPLAAALGQVGGFMPALIHVAAVGTETGNLAELLLRLADSLDFEVDISLRRIISLLEPAIILVMGLMVGFIVLAILLPIFNLGSALGR